MTQVAGASRLLPYLPKVWPGLHAVEDHSAGRSCDQITGVFSSCHDTEAGWCGFDMTGPETILWIMYKSLFWMSFDVSVQCLLMSAGEERSGAIDVLTANDKELRIELKRRLHDRMQMQLMGTNQADPVRYASGGFKARHYEKRFGAELGKHVTSGITSAYS